MLIPTSLPGVLGRTQLVLQKHGPTILTAVGLVAMTSGAFLAVKQTMKLEETLAMNEDRVEASRVGPFETDRARQRELYKAYLKNVFEFIKLYGPAVSLFIAGGGSVLAGHGIMQKRQVALVAAYNAVEKSFQAYRARVIEDLGEDKDRDYILGINEKIEKGEDGRKTTTLDVDPSKMSQFARVFDESNDYWQREENYNQFFLTTEQNIINDILLHRGHVFLNEIYDRLGFKRVPEGNVLGWIVGEDQPNFIDFGIYDASTQAKRNFINGYEKSIWLDFKVTEILSKI